MKSSFQALKPFGWLLMACLFTPRAAHAGEWQVTYEKSANYNNETIVIQIDPETFGLMSQPRKGTDIIRVSSQGTHETYELEGEAPSSYSSSDFDDSSSGSVILSWHGGLSYGQNWNAPFRHGASPGHADGKLNIHPVFHWKRTQNYNPQTQVYYDDPNENPSDTPPQYLCYVERATVSASEGIYQNDGLGMDYNSDHPFKGTQFTFDSVTNPLQNEADAEGDTAGGALNFNGFPPIAYSYQRADYSSDKSKVTLLRTGGSETVTGADRSFSGSISLNTAYENNPHDNNPYDKQAQAEINFGYGVTIANVAINAAPYKGAITQSKPDFKEYNAYAKQNYTLNGVDEATTDTAFWDGTGSYSASGNLDGSNASIFSEQLYKWEVSGDGTPIIPAPNGPETTDTYKPTGTPEIFSSKEFHLDLGQGNDGFPKTSTIKCKITDEAGSTEIPLQVTVHWYQPRWFVTTATPVTTVTGNQDPDKASGPIDPASVSPDDPDFQEMQTMLLYLQEQQEFIKTGATLVGDALKIEQEIASFYATGPLYELGIGAMGNVIGKAVDGIEKAKEVRAFATKAAGEAATARRLAQEGKGLKSAEEVARAEQTAVQLEQKATQAEHQAASLEQKANKAKEEAEKVGHFADNNLLNSHFADHGMDFGATTVAEYEEQAGEFLTGKVGPNTLEKVRPNGDIVRYNQKTEEFGVMTPEGTIRTYYQPNPAQHGYATNLDYFNAQ